jgi:hypothetical protein
MTTTSLVTNTVVTNGDSTFDALPQQRKSSVNLWGVVRRTDERVSVEDHPIWALMIF